MAQQPRPLSALMTSAQSGGSPYQSDRGANAAAFGVGVTRELAGLGDQIMRSADAMADQIIRTQNLENESAARDAATAYRTQTIEKWTSYGSLEGKAAVDGYAGFQKDLKDQHDALVNSLPNDQAKLMARRQMDGWYGQMLQSGALHRQKEQKTWSIESSKGAAAEAVATANLNRQDFGQALTSVERGVGEVRNQAEIKGTPPEMVQAEILRYRGQSWKTVLSNLAGEGNAGALRASEYFARVRDTMDPISQQEIQDALRPKVLQARADGVVQSVLGMGAAQAGGEAGYRNNIGNMIVSQAGWQGKGQPYKSFETFRTPEEGVAANTSNFRSLAKKIGPDASLADIARRWAPDDDGKTPLLKGNDSAAWARSVGRIAGVDPSAPLNVNDPDQMTAVMRAVNIHEHGRETVPPTAYRTGVEASISGRPAAGDLDQKTPSRDMVESVYRMTAGDPELQRTATSMMQGHVNVFNTANAQRKAELKDDLTNRRFALLQGEAIEIPETKIRAVDPDNADALIGELKSAQTRGQAFKALALASPEQVAASRTDLEGGVGILSDMLRSGSGVDMATEEGKAKDIAMRGDALKDFDTLLQRRNEQIKKDPTAYLLGKDDNVRAAWDVLQRNKNEDGWANFAAANLSAQERLGLSAGEQSLLPKTWRKNILESAQMADPKLAGRFMQQLERETGKFWPQIFGELSKGEDGLPKPYVALGLMQDPVARATFAELLQVEKGKPGATKSLLAAKDKDAPKAVAEKVNEQMVDFLSTFSRGRGGVALASSLNDAAVLLAQGFAVSTSSDEAAARATQSIMANFDVEVSEGSHIARAPKGLGKDMVTATDFVRRSLTAAELLPYADRTGVYSPQALATAQERNARQGTWVTSPSYDGWVLIGADNDVVLRRDGKPVVVPFIGVKDILLRRGQTTTPGDVTVAP